MEKLMSITDHIRIVKSRVETYTSPLEKIQRFLSEADTGKATKSEQAIVVAVQDAERHRVRAVVEHGLRLEGLLVPRRLEPPHVCPSETVDHGGVVIGRSPTVECAAGVRTMSAMFWATSSIAPLRRWSDCSNRSVTVCS